MLIDQTHLLFYILKQALMPSKPSNIKTMKRFLRDVMKKQTSFR